MAEFLNTIDLLGDKAVTRALIERTITEFHDDKVTNVGREAFYGCTALTSVNLPNLYSGSSLDSRVFQGCSALTNVSIPRAPSLYNYFFYGCTSLAFIDLPKVHTLLQGCLGGCSSLKTVALRNESTCTLDRSSAFSKTPFASGKSGGTLLVPRSLVTKYPIATNWSVVIAWNANNRVLALEDYTVDGTITGEIDWDKLNGGN